MDSKLEDAVIEEFDVVIIGAGISGLTAAALLSKANLKVCRHCLKVTVMLNYSPFYEYFIFIVQ